MTISSIGLERVGYAPRQRVLILPRFSALSVGVIKRAIDLCVALVGLVLGLPLFV